MASGACSLPVVLFYGAAFTPAALAGACVGKKIVACISDRVFVCRSHDRLPAEYLGVHVLRSRALFPCSSPTS